MGELTQAFGADPTALQRVDGPVVILEGVHELQDGSHAADGGVDGGGANELRRQVSVEGQLDLRVHMCVCTDNNNTHTHAINKNEHYDENNIYNLQVYNSQ